MQEKVGSPGRRFNTEAVVRRTGVPAATFRAWERRYGFPHPDRDGQGRRLYSDGDVAAIRWLQAQTESGVAISRAVDMLRQGHVQVTSGPEAPNGPFSVERHAVRSLGSIRAELTNALLEFDAARAEPVLAEAFGLYSVTEVCLQALEPMLIDIGERWHAGSVTVAQEHFASSFVMSRFAWLLRVYSREDEPARQLVVTACAPDEWHHLGILMVSVLLAREGYRVRYLGPNLPLEALLTPTLLHANPALLVLSAHMPESARQLPAVREVLASVSHPTPRFAYGGRAFVEQPELRQKVPGTYLGNDARVAVTSVRELLGPPGLPLAR
jgi:MerR family transcriptional regulator, light-induced transcriptional regulator